MHTVQSIFKLNSLFQMGCIKHVHLYTLVRGEYTHLDNMTNCVIFPLYWFFFKQVKDEFLRVEFNY